MAKRHDWLVEVALEAARRREREVGWALRQLPPELRNFLFDDGSIGGVVATFEQPAADQATGRARRRKAEREQEAERAVPAERGEAGVAELPAEGEAAEVERRRRLLREYMEATGCSEYQIYETATKLKLHSCYKPQFREWKNGKLPADSVTAQSLERFLAEKKPPSAKKSKSSPR